MPKVCDVAVIVGYADATGINEQTQPSGKAKEVEGEARQRCCSTMNSQGFTVSFS